MSIPTILKMSMVVVLAAINMGNEGCEQKEEEPARKLRKRASISRIYVPSHMELPGGEKANFDYIVNSQMSHVISEHDEFVPSLGAFEINSAFSEMGRLSNEDFRSLMEVERQTGAQIFALSDSTPSCIRYAPMLDIGGAVESFEIVGKGGITFGFGPNVSPTKVSAKFYVERARLHANFQAYHPLRLESPLATGRVPANHTTVDIGTTVDFGFGHVNFNWFYKTPLAEVSYNALSASLKAMAEDFDKKAIAKNQPIWETKVREDHDTFISIYGGRHDGLMVGDEVEVYNTRYFWSGEPCKSKFEGTTRVKTSGPDGIYRIVQTEDFISLAIPIAGDGTRIIAGAQVLLHRFAGDYEDGEAEAGNVKP